MSARRTLDCAEQVLLGELVKYADIAASQRPASTPSKVTRRQLGEIEAGIQAQSRSRSQKIQSMRKKLWLLDRSLLDQQIQ